MKKGLRYLRLVSVLSLYFGFNEGRFKIDKTGFCFKPWLGFNDGRFKIVMTGFCLKALFSNGF